MNNFVVIARFDKKTDDKIMNLRKQMINVGYSVPEWSPHITIAAYENFDKTLLCEWAFEFTSKQSKKIEISLHSMSVLPPSEKHPNTAVLCLDPAHSKSFIDFYYGFHEKHEEYCTGIGLFNSIAHDNPVIHATIGVVRVKELQKAMELIFSSNVFGKTKIIALEVYTYSMELIKRFDL